MAQPFMNNNFVASGPLGGYMAGMQQSYDQANADRGLRDSDLGFLEKLHNYQMSQAEDPARLSEFQQRQNTADTANQVFGTGKPFQTAVSGLDTKMSADKTAQIEDSLKQAQVRGETFSQISGELQHNPLGPPTDGASLTRWQKDIKPRLEKAGVPNVPDAPDPRFVDQIHAGSESYALNAPKLRQALEQIRAEGGQKVKSIQETGTEQRLTQAQANEFARSFPSTDKVMAEITQKMANGNASPNEQKMYMANLMTKMIGPMNKNIPLLLDQLEDMNSADPKTRAKAQSKMKTALYDMMGMGNPEDFGTQGSTQPTPSTATPKVGNTADKAKVDQWVKNNPGKDRKAIIEYAKSKGALPKDYSE